MTVAMHVARRSSHVTDASANIAMHVRVTREHIRVCRWGARSGTWHLHAVRVCRRGIWGVGAVTGTSATPVPSGGIGEVAAVVLGLASAKAALTS